MQGFLMLRKNYFLAAGLAAAAAGLAAAAVAALGSSIAARVV